MPASKRQQLEEKIGKLVSSVLADADVQTLRLAMRAHQNPEQVRRVQGAASGLIQAYTAALQSIGVQSRYKAWRARQDPDELATLDAEIARVKKRGYSFSGAARVPRVKRKKH